MSLEWKTVELKTIANVTMGQSPKSEFYNDNFDGMPFLQGNKTFGDKYPSFELYTRSIKKVAEKNTVLMSVRAPVGDLNIAPEDICIGRGLCSLQMKNGDDEFLYYLLKSNISHLINKESGTVFGSINKNDIETFEVTLPESSEDQMKILTILRNIDKKIELCKNLNKNLEEQLLRIFDSWFLKFELSNEFSDSKLGLIPKGWKIDYLGSKKSCSIIKSGIDEFDNSKIYIATADVDNSIITSKDTLITMDDKPSRANMQPISKSIWFAKMIDSKKLIMVDEYCNDLLNNYIFSTGFCGLKCVDKYFYYLWTFLLTDVFDVMKNNFCTGTTMQAINNKDTKLIEFVLPDDKTITQFNSIAKPMFKKIYYNNLEIKKLQRLRDTLLPKLMSGEIDVSKINCDLKIIIRKIYIKSSKLFLWRYLSENKNYIKNTKSNETLLKSRTIHKINKFLAKFTTRYRYYRQ